MNKKITLDDYEKDIEAHISEDSDLENLQREMTLVKAAAKHHMTRKKSITIRVHELDLEAIKLIASKHGVPYQTYINMVIHREASVFL